MYVEELSNEYWKETKYYIPNGYTFGSRVRRIYRGHEHYSLKFKAGVSRMMAIKILKNVFFQFIEKFIDSIHLVVSLLRLFGFERKKARYGG